jgi:hypothetical protein
MSCLENDLFVCNISYPRTDTQESYLQAKTVSGRAARVPDADSSSPFSTTLHLGMAARPRIGMSLSMVWKAKTPI